MIYKDKLKIKINTNMKISGEFIVNEIRGRRCNARSSIPGFKIVVDIKEGEVAYVNYEYYLPLPKSNKIEGEFAIITDEEDIIIPFEIYIENNIIINKNFNIDDITPLIFMSEEFGNIFPDDSLEYMLWKIYSKDNVNERNIEEFFIAIGKKERITYKEQNNIVIKKKESKDIVYANIQRQLFNYITNKDCADNVLTKIASYIEDLYNLNEDEYKIKIVEYFWAKIANDLTKIDYIIDSLSKIEIKDDILFLSLFQYICAIEFNTEEIINSALKNLELKAYQNEYSILFWCVYDLKTKTDVNVNDRYIWLKRLISLGCKNPFIYYELLKCIDKFDTALLRLDVIEVSVLYWAYKHDLLSDRLIKHIIENTIFRAAYSSQLLSILESEYNKKESLNILEVICTLLIRGNNTTKRAFKWYKLGVYNNINTITGLYSYFLYSMPSCYLDLLPMEIYLYFKNNRMLTEKNKQSLYANIIYNKEKIIDIYNYYENDIKAYTIKSLSERRISDELVILYNEIDLGIILDKQLSHCLLNVYCEFKFRCNRDDVEHLIILQERLENPIDTWLVDHVSQVRIPDKKFHIIMVDKNGTKIYDKNNEVSYKRMIEYSNDIEEALELGNTHIVALMENDKPSISTYEQINKKKWLRSYYQRLIQEKLLKYYLEKNTLKAHILDFNIDLLKDKKAFINYYLDANLYNYALDAGVKVGFDNLETDVKTDILNSIINSNDEFTNDMAKDLAFNIFREGSKDESLLNYLYNNNLLTLYEEIENYSVLYDKLLDNQEFSDKLVNLCEELITRDEGYAPIGLYAILWERKNYLRTMEMLEMLRKFSISKEISDDIKKFISNELLKLINSNIYLDWMMKFKNFGVLPSYLNDKVILTFKNKGYIRYKYINKKYDNIDLELNYIVKGKNVVAIPMFYGDEIEYQLFDENHKIIGEKQRFRNTTLIGGGSYMDGYDRLNEIIYARENDSPDLIEKICQYKSLKDMALNIFIPRS